MLVMKQLNTGQQRACIRENKNGSIPKFKLQQMFLINDIIWLCPDT